MNDKTSLDVNEPAIGSIDSIDELDTPKQTHSATLHSIDDFAGRVYPEEDDHDAESPTIPKAVKYGLPTLFFSLMGLFTIGYLHLTASTQESGFEKRAVVDPKVNTHAIEPAVVEKDSRFLPSTDVVAEPRAPTKEAKSISLNNRTANTASPPQSQESLGKGNQRLRAVEMSLQDLSTQLQSLESSLRTFVTSAQLTETHQQISQGMSTLEDNITALTATVREHSQWQLTQQALQESEPPFQLIAIDQWGGAYSATFSGPQHDFFSVGDTHRGWRIAQFPTATSVQVCERETQVCKTLIVEGATP